MTLAAGRTGPGAMGAAGPPFLRHLPPLGRDLWEHSFVYDTPAVPENPTFTVVGLFAGIGGLELGFHAGDRR